MIDSTKSSNSQSNIKSQMILKKYIYLPVWNMLLKYSKFIWFLSFDLHLKSQHSTIFTNLKKKANKKMVNKKTQQLTIS